MPFFSRQNLSPVDWGPLSIPRDLRSPIGVHLIYAETWQPQSGDCLQFPGLSPYRGLSRTVTVDTSSRWELEWKNYIILCLCTSRAVGTVHLLVYSVYLWNYNFLWVRDEYSKFVTGIFLKDMAIVKQFLLKVWHNGQVYHSLKCCFSSAFRLFKGTTTPAKSDNSAAYIILE